MPCLTVPYTFDTIRQIIANYTRKIKYPKTESPTFEFEC